MVKHIIKGKFEEDEKTTTNASHYIKDVNIDGKVDSILFII